MKHTTVTNKLLRNVCCTQTHSIPMWRPLKIEGMQPLYRRHCVDSKSVTISCTLSSFNSLFLLLSYYHHFFRFILCSFLLLGVLCDLYDFSCGRKSFFIFFFSYRSCMWHASFSHNVDKHTYTPNNTHRILSAMLLIIYVKFVWKWNLCFWLY